MRFRITAFILLFMFAQTLFSCFYEGDCDPVPEFFVVTGFEDSDYMIPTGREQPSLEVVGTGQSADWEELRLWVQLDIDYIAARQPDFGATLQALSCLDPGFGGSTVGMDTLFVKTVYDYDAAHPAGTLLNDIIRLTPQPTTRPRANQNLISVADFLEKAEKRLVYKSFGLYLAHPPEAPRSDFALRITCRMNDGTWFTHTTETITVTKR